MERKLNNLRFGVPLLLGSFLVSFALLFGGARLIGSGGDGGDIGVPGDGADTGAGPTAPGGGPAGAQTMLEITGRNIQFDKNTLTVPAGQEITLTFNNEDAGVLHNVAIYQDQTAQQQIFVGELFTGADSREYTFTAPEPGRYFYRCDVHPDQMTGTLVVEAAAGGAPPAPGGGQAGPQTALEITGQNIQFDKGTLTVPAGQEITLTFRNEDAGVLHNVAIYQDETAEQRIFVGELFTGADSREYMFMAPGPGRYFYRCDVHPDQMTGTLVVE